MKWIALLILITALCGYAYGQTLDPYHKAVLDYYYLALTNSSALQGNLDMGGYKIINRTYVKSTTNFTMRSIDTWINMAATTQVITNFLLDATSVTGTSFNVMSDESSLFDVVIKASGSQTINGTNQFALKPEEALSIVSDGSNWKVY